MPNPPKAKSPCITCTVHITDKVKGGSICCCVCERWCHIPCTQPLLDPAMVKWFDEMHKANGFHNWSCHNCMVAYHKMNVRICKIEKRMDKLDDAVAVNSATSTANSEKIEKVDKEVNVVKESVAKVRHEAVADATKAWSAELREREGRKTNIIIFGLQEPSLEITSGMMRKAEDEREIGALFSDMCANVDKEQDIKYSTRLGILGPSAAENPRPLKISFRTQGHREEVFSKARNLPKTRFKNCSLIPDLTNLQRTEDSDLMKEAEQMNLRMSAEERLNWVYRCTGKKGERLISKLKVRPGQPGQGRWDRTDQHDRTNANNQQQDRTTTHQDSRTNGQTAGETDTTDMEDSEEEEEDDHTGQSRSQKRGRGHSSDTSPRQQRKSKQKKQSNQ